MRDYKYILFDLDGTLTDPKEGITKSVAYALKHFGIDVEDLDTLCKFIGPPLKDSFMQYYGLSEMHTLRWKNTGNILNRVECFKTKCMTGWKIC